MEKFKVIQPSKLLAPYVKQYWFLSMDEFSQGSQRFVPFGSIVLFFHREGQAYHIPNNSIHGTSCISGQTTTYTNLMYSGKVNLIAIVFQPIGAMMFLREPPIEFKDQHVGMDDLNDSQILELERQLAEIEDDNTCIKLIERFLLKRIYQVDELNYKRLSAVIKSVNTGNRDLTLLAETACLGYKQFKRIFTENVGANPKDFIRISRFQQALYVLQINRRITISQLAEDCGYYDKSHLIRELKELSGFTPGRFLEVSDQYYSPYHALFRSAFIDNPLN